MENLFKKKGVAFALVCICMALWGSLFPMIKLGYSAFQIDTEYVPNILLFAGVRFIICGVAIIIIASSRDKKIAIPKRGSLIPAFWIAFFSIILHYSFTYIGLSVTSGSKTAILKQVGTLLIICFAFLFDRNDRFTYKKLFGGILGFLSIFVVNLNGLKLDFNFADPLIIAASFCTVAASIFSKKAYQKFDPITTLGYAQLFGGVVLTGVGLTFGGRILHCNGQSLAVLGYICFASVVGYLLWNVSIKFCNLSMLFTTKFTESLFAALFSAMILQENIFTLSYFMALLFVSTGIIISNRQK